MIEPARIFSGAVWSEGEIIGKDQVHLTKGGMDRLVHSVAEMVRDKREGVFSNWITPGCPVELDFDSWLPEYRSRNVGKLPSVEFTEVAPTTRKRCNGSWNKNSAKRRKQR